MNLTVTTRKGLRWNSRGRGSNPCSGVSHCCLSSTKFIHSNLHIKYKNNSCIIICAHMRQWLRLSCNCVLNSSFNHTSYTFLSQEHMSPRINLLTSEWFHSSVGKNTAPAAQSSWILIPLKFFWCTYETVIEIVQKV